MRTSILLLALVALFAVCVSAQSSTGGSGPVATTICQRITASQNLDISSAADQFKAMTTLIVRVAYGTNTTGGAAVGIFNAPATKPYFNGQITYRNGTISPSPFASQLSGAATPDFTDAAYSTSLGSLVNHLVQFFGAPLGCTVGSTAFPAYSSVYGAFGTFNQKQVHANMAISSSVFSSFNNQVVNAAVSMGATADDALAVKAVLAQYGRDNIAADGSMICSQADCACATGVTGDNCDNMNAVASTSASFVTLAAAALVSLFAMRR